MISYRDVPLAAVQDRRSLRKTDLIHAPQPSLPTNKLCQYTSHGFAPDLQSRTAGCEVEFSYWLLVCDGPEPKAQGPETKA